MSEENQDARRLGLMRVNRSLLVAALHLPEDTQILAVSDDIVTGDLLFRFSHPSLPPVKEGDHLYTFTPMLRSIVPQVPHFIEFDGFWGAGGVFGKAEETREEK